MLKFVLEYGRQVSQFTQLPILLMALELPQGQVTRQSGYGMQRVESRLGSHSMGITIGSVLLPSHLMAPELSLGQMIRQSGYGMQRVESRLGSHSQGITIGSVQLPSHLMAPELS